MSLSVPINAFRETKLSRILARVDVKEDVVLLVKLSTASSILPNLETISSILASILAEKSVTFEPSSSTELSTIAPKSFLI